MAFKSHFWKYTYETGKNLSRTFGKDIKIVVQIKDDEYPDISWLGEFTETKAGAIRVPEYMVPDEWTWRMYNRPCYFKPFNTIKGTYDYYRIAGKTPLRAAVEAVKQARSDMEYLHEFEVGDRYMVGVIVTIFYKGIEIADDSVWGNDVSIYTDKNQESLEETAFDVAYDAVVSAQKKLQELEANTTEIDRLVAAYKRISAWRKVN